MVGLDDGLEPEGLVPQGTAIVVDARAADTEAGLGGELFTEVQSGILFSRFGRYIEVRATLKASPEGLSPVLSDIRVQPHVIPVEIDIKPGSFPNSINPFGRGLIPVAILGSEVFDVSAIDVTTLRFGPAQVATRHDLTDDWDYNEHLADVNFDGFMDLVTHFTTQDTGIACGDIEAVLSGALLDGTPFEGTDAVRTVGCNSNRPSRGFTLRGFERMQERQSRLNSEDQSRPSDLVEDQRAD